MKRNQKTDLAVMLIGCIFIIIIVAGIWGLVNYRKDQIKIYQCLKPIGEAVCKDSVGKLIEIYSASFWEEGQVQPYYMTCQRNNFDPRSTSVETFQRKFLSEEVERCKG